MRSPMIRLIASAALLVSLASVAIAAPRFTPGLAPLTPGLRPFGALPHDRQLLRIFPGESIVVGMWGYLEGAEWPSGANEAVMANLQPCLLAGTDHPELATATTLSCLQVPSLTWSRTPQSIAGAHMAADLSASATPAPGSYTLVVTLNDAPLSTLLGPAALNQLRSNPITIKIGPAEGQTEELAWLLRLAGAAERAYDWSTTVTRANALLAVYPSSVHALCMRGNAQGELGDRIAAIASYTAALNALQTQADTLTPDFAASSTLVSDWISGIEGDIAALEDPPPPDE